MPGYGRHFLPLLLALVSLLIVFVSSSARAADSITLVASKPQIRPDESVRVTAQSPTPLNLPARWFSDGQILDGNEGIELLHSFPQNGRLRISVVFADGSSAYIDILVISNPFIKLGELIPNPAGSDTNAETVLLKNTGSEDANLKGWELRSRTTTTKIAIEGVVPASGQLEIVVSSKLRNSGGVYDLFNESNEFVDTVTYPAVKEGEKVRREGIVWTVEGSAAPLPAPSTSVSKPAASPTTYEKAHVVGKVTLPKGRTLDMLTPQNESVHVVVHASYVTPRPRLHKGDTLEVTGTWRRSRLGPYVSVREGDTFQVVSTAPVAAARATSVANVPRRVKSPTTSFLEPAVSQVLPRPPETPLEEPNAAAREPLRVERVRPRQPRWAVFPYSASVASVCAGILILSYPRKTV